MDPALFLTQKIIKIFLYIVTTPNAFQINMWSERIAWLFLLAVWAFKDSVTKSIQATPESVVVSSFLILILELFLAFHDFVW
jgi:hypothetical protein